MNLDMHHIEAYCDHQMPDHHAWFYEKLNGYHAISDYRQDICRYLSTEILRYDTFPLWNKELILTLFPNLAQTLQSITIMPILASPPTFDAGIMEYEGKPYLLVDLLNIADYTQSVKEMCYILHNLCHIQLLRYAFHTYFTAPLTYIEQLEYRFFSEGLILYLSWNEDVHQYVFQNKAYDKRKKQAFSLLYQALQLEDQTLQKHVLKTLKTANLWDCFTDVAGMFFCDDIFHLHQVKGLLTYIHQGWKGISNTLFSLNHKQE